MARFNHAVSVAFEVISNDEQGDDITSEMLKAALQERIRLLDESDAWIEACMSPFDTYEMDD
jgi:hypothetical protein